MSYGSFDERSPRRDNPRRCRNQDEREDAMVASIRDAMGAGRLTIVIAGTLHVAKLHEAFAAASPMTVSLVRATAPGDTDHTKRNSYLLATPQILTIRPSEAFDAGPHWTP